MSGHRTEGAVKSCRLLLHEVHCTAQSGERILHPCNQDYRSGLYAVMGANGSGKSTLIRAIAGLLPAVQGEVRFEQSGVRLTDAEFRRHLGYMPQQFAFYEDMKVRAYLQYVGRMKLMGNRELETSITAILSRLGLTDVRRRAIAHLSAGQRRKLMFAQAVLGHPALLLLDEPLQGMDVEERGLVMDWIHEIARDRIVLMTTHHCELSDMTMAFIQFMDQGKMGEPRQRASWLRELANQVWEVESAVPREEWLRRFERWNNTWAGAGREGARRARVLSCSVTSRGVRARIMSDRETAHAARAVNGFSGTIRPVDPDLEDVYFYVTNLK